MSEVRKPLLLEIPTLETPGPLPGWAGNQDDWLPRHLPSPHCFVTRMPSPTSLF